jgi:enediyne polyketide synthase
VDLSLDPFELIGFAKAGALAREEMRVYDVRSAGFWPGEGCGFVVLMRHADAVAERRRIHALIRGWGVSSDGSGGMTRPEVEGQLLALRRAYRRAGFGPETVAYFEGHGTGTGVGDATELRVLARALAESPRFESVAAVGSIKSNIGHTKAAAGMAGVIKATMALQTQILPPTTGCEAPHPELTGKTAALRVLMEGEPWPTDRPLRAAVSAMGFGGINTHVVLEGAASERRAALGPRDRELLSSAQDAELFLLGARDAKELRGQIEHLLAFAARLSRAELGDLAAQLSRGLDTTEHRAAIVASTPAELARGFETLRAWLAEGVAVRLDKRSGFFLGSGLAAPRIGFLFPEQGSPAHLDGGAWRRRFEFVRELYASAALPASGHGIDTAVAQPAIVMASIAGLRALERMGVTARVALGHSLGELTAFHWVGAFGEAALLALATARGKAMAELGSPTGAMASIGAGPHDVGALLDGEPVVIAGLNSPCQTVISGPGPAVATVIARARASGLHAASLPVSHAFHSPLVAAAVPALAEHLARQLFQPLQRTVVSTVTGGALGAGEDLRALLSRQVTSPVRFAEAAAAVLGAADLLIEVGPGRVLTGLISEMADTPVVAVDAGGPSLRGLLQAIGASFALGAPVDHGALFTGRFTRPFELDWRPRFFQNPCELAPVPDGTEPRHLDEPTDPDTAVDRPPPVSVPASPLALVRELVAARTELPLAAVKDDSRLLGDLHLNSIAVSQLVAEAARRLGVPPPLAPTEWARATVGEVARALKELVDTGAAAAIDEQAAFPPGIDTWIRAFSVELVDRALLRRAASAGPGQWRVIGPPESPLAAALHDAFARLEGGGVVVCLPPDPDERHLGLMLEAGHAVLREHGPTRFVLVQHGGGGGAFARTLHLEASDLTTCVVDVPQGHPEAAAWVIAEAGAAVGYAEAHYDISGCRREPVLRLLPVDGALTDGGPAEPPLAPSDVLLVTGGGKGIAAECALALAEEMGLRLVLMGRSQPATDVQLSTNLQRLAANGIRFHYVVADVTDAEAVRAAIREAEAEVGPITAVLHGAGTNEPRLLSALDEAAFLRTLHPKVQGARNVLAAVNPDRLRLFVAFGSLIARTGMRGEADYGLANEWLARLVEGWQAEHPHCRCLTVEWSVWSGTGMGERLGRVDALMRAGITPISPDEGVSALRRLLAHRLPCVSVVVAGRFGDSPTHKIERPELPFLRFLERPRVHYPGVELVADSEVSSDSDPYLDDHVFEGQRLLPAVMGLEAMAQAAMALAETTEPPIFENVRFDRPIVVPDGAPVTLRVAALAREAGRIDVALRSHGTAFQVDHFKATCRFGDRERRARQGQEFHEVLEGELPPVEIDPETDLYGGLLFQRGRFRRVRRYWHLRARECVAEIGPSTASGWFGRYLPPALILGDPGARDAGIHAIQACIPHATVLPVGVDCLVPGALETSHMCLVRALERSREGDTFTYDVEVTATDGRLLERWDGLRLTAVSGMAHLNGWAAALLGPYVERQLAELIPGAAVAVVVDRNPAAHRRAPSDLAIRRVLGEAKRVWRRSDGEPELPAGPNGQVSAAHADGLIMAVKGYGPVGCDIEPVVAREPYPVAGPLSRVVPPGACPRGAGGALAGSVSRHDEMLVRVPGGTLRVR